MPRVIKRKKIQPLKKQTQQYLFQYPFVEMPVTFDVDQKYRLRQSKSAQYGFLVPQTSYQCCNCKNPIDFQTSSFFKRVRFNNVVITICSDCV